MTCHPGEVAVIDDISSGVWKTWRSNRVNDDVPWRNEGIPAVDVSPEDMLIVISEEGPRSALRLVYVLCRHGAFWIAHAGVTGT